MSIYGVDIGTMNIVSQTKIEDSKIQLKKIRNTFLPLDYNILEFSELQNQKIEYVSLDDNKTVVVLGEDQYKLSNILNKPIKRTMKQGIIQQDEISQIDILTLMINKVVPKEPGKAIFSIPQEPIDRIDQPSVLYHEQVFKKIFTSLGYVSEQLNESMQIIFSECKSDNYTGIQISFGQGLTNICCAYKGTPTLQFSIQRGGDWIDYNQSKSIGVLQSRVTQVKEKDLNLNTYMATQNKSDRRIKEQLQFFYKNLITYQLQKIVEKFNLNSENLIIEDEMKIIISGGTSLAGGFIDIFKDIFDEVSDFPYNVSEIKYQKDPLTQVQEGCLLYQLWKEKSKKGV